MPGAVLVAVPVTPTNPLTLDRLAPLEGDTFEGAPFAVAVVLEDAARAAAAPILELLEGDVHLVPCTRTSDATPSLDALARRLGASRVRVLGDDRRTPTTAGVVLVGPLRSHYGIAESTRLVLAGLEASGLPIAVVPLDDDPAAVEGLRAAAALRAGGGRVVNILCTLMDQLPPLAQVLGDAFFDGAHTVGLWHWELDVFPRRMWAGLAIVDEVWAGSEHAAIGIRATGKVPVDVFPLPILERSDPKPTRSSAGLDDRFTFLTMFDHLSLAARKNPEATVRAFVRAFPRPSASGPRLVVKTMNRTAAPDADRALRDLARGRSDVRFLDADLSPTERDRLVAASDVLVSLHRAEGFGLTLAEAMAAGTIAMGTGWSGNTDFMTPDNSVLVPYELAPVPAGIPPYPPGAPWAEADVAAAAEQMHRLVADDAWRDALRAQARADLAATRHPSVAGAWVRRRLGAV
jgi:hypothetical protein